MTVFKRKRKDRGKIIESRDYYGWLRPAEGKRRRVRLFTDKRASEMELAVLQRREDQIRNGTADPFEGPMTQPIAVHVAGYAEHLASVNGGTNTPRHVNQTTSKVQRIVADARWRTIGDIRPSDAERVLASYRAGGMAVDTTNGYRRAVKAFSSWLYHDRRARDHRLVSVRLVHVEDEDREHPRRVLEPADFDRLLTVTATGPDVLGMTGRARRLLYALAAATGFRGKSLDSLTWASFDFDAATVTVAKAYNKRRTARTQPIPADVVTAFSVWHDERVDDDGTRVFVLPKLGPHTDGFRCAEMLRHDLNAAGIEYQTDDGFFDFHSLRCQFCTQIVSDPATTLSDIKALVQHGNIELTLARYAKPSIASERAAVERMRPILSDESKATRRMHG